MSRYVCSVILCFALPLTVSQAAWAEVPVSLSKSPQRAEMPIPSLELSPRAAARVGKQVWLNETGGDRDAITSWNRGEDFASLGIGHFIWFPAGLKTPFAESFPKVANFLRERGAKLPDWLDKPKIPACPWTSRAQFQAEFQAQEMRALRAFLLSTVPLQAEYLALRMRESLPKILATIDRPEDRVRARQQFIRVVKASSDLYPLIDYVNFKGEGIVESETFVNAKTGAREGWGLKHVLLAMKGRVTDRRHALDDFADAARFVLLRRIANNPPSARWRRGWLVRVATYRRPLK